MILFHKVCKLKKCGIQKGFAFFLLTFITALKTYFFYEYFPTFKHWINIKRIIKRLKILLRITETYFILGLHVNDFRCNQFASHKQNGRSSLPNSSKFERP